MILNVSGIQSLTKGLNEVRPGRPEQLDSAPSGLSDTLVSQ